MTVPSASAGPVLVTGGAGFIGSNLADRLARDGFDVIVLDALTRPGVERNLDWLTRRHPGRITPIVGDVRDAATVAAATAGARAVFHLAAQVAVTTSLVDPAADFDVNLRGTLTVLEALRRRAANEGAATPLIFASTNKVYGDLSDIALEVQGDAWLPRDPALRARGIGEDRPLDFHTPYGCSKGAADQYVLDYARSFGVPTAVMRMSCIYGPRQMGTEDQGWVAHFLIRALKGEPISIFGDGRQVRDILNVADAVSAYLAAWARIDQVAGRAFNLGGGPANAVSLRRLIAHIETLVGRPVETRLSDWRAGDQRYFVADTSAARAALGLAPAIGWRDGVAELAAWLEAAAPEISAPGTAAPGTAEPEASGTGTGHGRRKPRPRLATPAVRGARAADAPLRLLMTADSVGGVWTYALDLAQALAPRGVETSLAVLGPAPSPAAAADAAAVPGLSLIETGLPLDWLAETPRDITDAATALAAIAREARPDLVQLNAPAFAAGARFPAPVLGVAHSCVATWWAAVHGGPLPEDFRWRAAAQRRGLEACAAVVAPSAAFAAATAAAYGLPRPLVVPNGRAAPPAPAADAPRERRIFTAGRLWDEGKNLAALDAAAALIDAAVCAAGPTEGPNGARACLRHARALGPLAPAAVRDWLARTPVFASTALYEPFGLAVLEAAQAGCALVLADIASFREIWGDAAVFVPPKDPGAIAAALAALLDAPDRAAALGAAARRRAERHTPAAMAEGMLGVYRTLLPADLRARAEAAA
ncbi:MAG TPA: SDR family NAD(P)-dependent oxidoreductase [Amaricoccus sp.]|nr:SDR family NAD(P)-dependent oxidoreductase [Amaricoccus sp.]